MRAEGLSFVTFSFYSPSLSLSLHLSCSDVHTYVGGGRWSVGNWSVGASVWVRVEIFCRFLCEPFYDTSSYTKMAIDSCKRIRNKILFRRAIYARIVREYEREKILRIYVCVLVFTVDRSFQNILRVNASEYNAGMKALRACILELPSMPPAVSRCLRWGTCRDFQEAQVISGRTRTWFKLSY